MDIFASIRQRIFSKRFFYMLLFAVLMWIDWMAGTRSQWFWWITNNFVGVVMAFIMFTAYKPREFRSPFYLIYGILGAASVPLGYLYWYRHQVGNILAFCVTVPLNCWILGLAVFKLVEKSIVKKEIKIYLHKREIVFTVCMLLMLLSRSTDIWPLYFLVIFLTLWHTPFTEKDRKSLLWGALDGIILGFFVFQALAYYCAPYDVVRYGGAYRECNRNGCMYLVTLAAFLGENYLYRLQEEGKEKDRTFWGTFRIVVGWCFLAGMSALLFFTGCRTAMVGEMVLLVVYAVLAERKIFHKSILKILLRAGLYGITTIVAVPIVYLTIRYIPPLCGAPRYLWAKSQYGVQPGASIDDEHYISFEAAMQELLGRFGRLELPEALKISRIEESVFAMHVRAEEQEMKPQEDNSLLQIHYWRGDEEPYEVDEVFWIPKAFQTGISSVDIRLQIYITYLRESNLVGHPIQDGYYKIQAGNGTAPWAVGNAQNWIIYALYFYGIPTGILVTLLFMAEVLTIISHFFKGKRDRLICLLFYLAFFVMGMQEIVWVPGQIILVMLFFVVLFAGEDRKDLTRTDALL